VAAFVSRLHTMSPADYAAWAARGEPAQCRAPGAAGGERDAVARGLAALHLYACHTCHAIPGVVGSDPQVGPPLDAFATRALIAGKLANTHDNLVEWIRRPQHFDAQTAMPDHGVTAGDASDMAAYLATLR
jgi:cytochrome c1